MPFPGDGFYDAANSFSSLSISDGTTQTGSFTNVTDYGWLSLVVTRDNTAGPGDTVQVSWSVDGTNEFVADTLTLTSDRGEQTIPAYLPYVRIIYTNNSGQTASVSIALTIRPGVGPVGISSGFASTNAYTKGLVGVPVSGIRNESSGAFTTSDGNFSPLAVDRSGRVFVVPSAYATVLDPGLVLDGSSGVALYSAFDAAGLRITGDIDIRIAVAPSTWNNTSEKALVARYSGTDGYSFTLSSGGKPQFRWVDNSGVVHTATSTAQAATSGALLLRVTVDVDNGASGRTITFYTKSYVTASVATDVAANTGWSTLGSAVTQAGVTTIKEVANSVDLQVGAEGGFKNLAGTVYAAVVQSGIAGTEVANPNFAAGTAGPTNVTDSHSNTFISDNTTSAYISSSQFVSVLADPNGAMQVSVDNGYVGGYTVKTAFLDGDTTNGNKQLVAAVTGKRIRVLSYMVNQAGGGAGTTKFNDASGGTVLCTAALGATSTQTEAAPAGTFLFQTTAGNALFLNTNSANARSVRVTYYEA